MQDQEELRRQVSFHSEKKSKINTSAFKNNFFFTAPVAVPDAPPPLHEHRAAARERERPAQEAPEEDGQVTTISLQYDKGNVLFCFVLWQPYRIAIHTNIQF